ncbi:MAG: hypothetical protein ACFE95_10490 [Candidatus Hodarchaeota archaeon]
MGNTYSSGWKERYIDPGVFLEGNNSLQIVMHNYPLSDQITSYLGPISGSEHHGFESIIWTRVNRAETFCYALRG